MRWSPSIKLKPSGKCARHNSLVWNMFMGSDLEVWVFKWDQQHEKPKDNWSGSNKHQVHGKNQKMLMCCGLGKDSSSSSLIWELKPGNANKGMGKWNKEGKCQQCIFKAVPIVGNWSSIWAVGLWDGVWACFRVLLRDLGDGSTNTGQSRVRVSPKKNSWSFLEKLSQEVQTSRHHQPVHCEQKGAKNYRSLHLEAKHGKCEVSRWVLDNACHNPQEIA